MAMQSSHKFMYDGVASEMFPNLKLACWSLVFSFWFWLKRWWWLDTLSRIEHWRGKVTRCLRATAGWTKRFTESQPGWCWCCLKPAGDGSIFLCWWLWKIQLRLKYPLFIRVYYSLTLLNHKINIAGKSMYLLQSLSLHFQLTLYYTSPQRVVTLK